MTTSAFDAMAAIATAKPKSKKSDKPSFHEPDLADAVTTFIDMKAAMDSAEVLMNQAGDQIRARGVQRRLEASIAARANVSTVVLNDLLTVTVQNRYSAVPEDQRTAVEAAFGPMFPQFFEATFAIALKPGSANDEAVLAHMIEALGAEFITTHFDIRRDLKVRPTFHDAYSTSRELQETAQPLFASQIIKHASPTIKVK